MQYTHQLCALSLWMPLLRARRVVRACALREPHLLEPLLRIAHRSVLVCTALRVAVAESTCAGWATDLRVRNEVRRRV